MNDANQRRSLLLHLGSVLKTLSQIVEHEREDESIGELIGTYKILADVPLLEYLFEQMTVREFATGVLHAFCLWPELLLEDPLDRSALATPVCARLFAGNPYGWSRYAAALREQVPWFGKDLLRSESDSPEAGTSRKVT